MLFPFWGHSHQNFEQTTKEHKYNDMEWWEKHSVSLTPQAVLSKNESTLVPSLVNLTFRGLSSFS